MDKTLLKGLHKGRRSRTCRGRRASSTMSRNAPAHAQQRPPHAADAHPRRLRGAGSDRRQLSGHPEDVRHGVRQQGQLDVRKIAPPHMATPGPRSGGDHPPVHPGRPGRHLHRQDRQRAADPRLLDGGRARWRTPCHRQGLAGRAVAVAPGRDARTARALPPPRPSPTARCCWPSSPRPVAWATPSTAASGATASAAWRRRCSTASSGPWPRWHLRAAGPVDPARMKTLAPVIEVAAQLSRSMGYTKGYFGSLSTPLRTNERTLQMTKPCHWTAYA